MEQELLVTFSFSPFQMTGKENPRGAHLPAQVRLGDISRSGAQWESLQINA